MTDPAMTELPKSDAAILFADVAGSTALYRALGNERAQRLIEKALQLLTEAAQRESGRVVKTIGDEAMCRFATATEAARAAIDMQRRIHAQPAEGGIELRLRIGFAHGPTVDRAGDVFGDVVNVAARLAAMAKADQILTTEATSVQFDHELRGSSRLFDKTPVKGIKEELSVVQVLWEQKNQTVLVAQGPTETVMAQRLRLASHGSEWTLTPADLPVWLGRSEECEIPLAAEFASRKHVRIEYRRGKFTLIDESSNGTYVEIEGHVLYVRNEAFALVGLGRFSLGTRPEGDEHAVSFRAE